MHNVLIQILGFDLHNAIWYGVLFDFRNYAMLGLDGFLLTQIKKEPIMYDTLIQCYIFSLCFYSPQPWACAVVIVELEINHVFY